MDPAIARGQTVICQDRGVCSKAGSLCGHDNGNKTGNSGGSTIPQAPESSNKQGGAIGHISRKSETKLPPDGGNFSGSQGGVMVVDEGSSGPQWGSATNQPTTLSFHTIITHYPTLLDSIHVHTCIHICTH